MIALWVIVTVLWRPAVSPDQPWASRRLVPFVLPALILGGIWAATWLKDQAAQLGRTRVTSAFVAVCGVASMLIPTALTTADLGVTATGVTAHGMAFRAIGTGELTAVNGLCQAIGPDASVVIVDQLTADRFAQVIRGICGTPAAVLDQPRRDGPHRGGGRHRGRRPPPGAARPAAGRTHRVRRRAQGSAQPADHPGGAQPDRAADPHLADPLHGVDVGPGRRRGLVSSRS